MSGPAPVGVLVYAKDLGRLSRFYCEVLGMAVRHADHDHHILGDGAAQIVVHAIPAVIADTIDVAIPPVPREDAAYKPFFTVPSLAAAREAARRAGGAVLEEEWQGPGFLARNAYDPEGNILQLRELVP